MEVHLYASGSVPRCVEVHFIPATHHGGEINFSRGQYLVLIHLPRPVPRNCMRLYGLYSYTAYTAYTSLYIIQLYTAFIQLIHYIIHHCPLPLRRGRSFPVHETKPFCRRPPGPPATAAKHSSTPCAELTDAAPVRGELPVLPLRRASSLNRYPAERAHHSGTSHSRLHLDIEPLWP